MLLTAEEQEYLHSTINIFNGKIEGINNKIKTIKRQAYGYRDQEFFELKILSMYDSIKRFVG